MRFISGAALAVVTISQEAALEPYAGKVAVGAVIRNRMRALSYWSDGTIEGTVLKPYQFSGYNTSTPNRVASFRLDDQIPPGTDCARAWKDSATTDPTAGALLYYNPAVVATPDWVSRCILTTKIGGHSFFTPKGNADAKVSRLAAHVGRHLPRLRLAFELRVQRLGPTRALSHAEPHHCCSAHRAAAAARHAD